MDVSHRVEHHRYTVLLAEMMFYFAKTGHEYGVIHGITTESCWLSQILRNLPSFVSSNTVFHLGAIYVENQRQHQDRFVPEQCKFRVHTAPRRFALELPVHHGLKVYENEEFAIIDKPSGWPMHATVDNAQENLLANLTQTSLTEGFSQKYYLTHRLDVPTRGLVFFAKSPTSQKNFNKLLQTHEVSKSYLALTEKIIPVGKHTHYMKPSPKAPKELQLTPEDPTWLRCELIVEDSVAIPASDYALTRIQLITGRTHQIRAQLSFLGGAIGGDEPYGARPMRGANSIALACVAMQFPWQNEDWTFSLSPKSVLADWTQLFKTKI